MSNQSENISEPNELSISVEDESNLENSGSSLKGHPVKKLKTNFKQLILSNISVCIGVLAIVIFYSLLGTLYWPIISYQGWICLIITSLSIVALLKDITDPDLVLLLAVAIFLIFSIITPAEALAGFSNTGVATIGVLFVVAAGISESSALSSTMRYVLGKDKMAFHISLARLLITVAFVSAFLNNTPVVAMMIPEVQAWCRKNGVAQSHMLMPLSYAAILGGTCTLIGTSTNLIVLGLALNYDQNLDLNLFEISKIALPSTFLGFLYIIFFSRKVLPSNVGSNIVSEDPKGYTVSVKVKPDSSLIGRSIEDNGLRNLSGLYLFGIERNGQLQDSVGPHSILVDNDILLFAGLPESVIDLYAFEGLEPDTENHHSLGVHRSLVEAVIAPRSPLVNQTVKQAQFRTKYKAAIVACLRHGEAIHEKIGQITLKTGDTLLLDATEDFLKYFKQSTDFALVSEVPETRIIRTQPKKEKAILAIFSSILMIILTTFQILPLFTNALLTAFVMITFKVLTVEQARFSVKTPLLLTIASAFGVSSALQNTGVAVILADSIVALFSPIGNIGILFGLFLSTSIMSSLISNAATAAIMFPIAWEFTNFSGISVKSVLYTLMLAGSTSFATPIGYQTNLMVLGPGGYRFSDFVKFGGPLQILLAFSNVILAYYLFPDS